MPEMIEALNLSKSFGSIKAVDDLSFTVSEGEVLGFLGPNGAGKSTTMKILTCFIAPSAGTARVCGHDIQDDPMAVRQTIGYLPESAPAYGEMTVLAFLNFVGRIRGFGGSSLSEAVDRVVGETQLDGVLHQTFETLSKGYKRRTCLAQALLHDPKVLIMDEPTDGLDPNQKHEVRALISRMAKDKVIVLSTHILEEVDSVCTRAIIINNGRLVSDATPEELRARSTRHGVVTLAIKGTEAGPAKAALEGLRPVDRVKALNGKKEASVHRFEIRPKAGKIIATDVAELARAKNWEVDELHVDPGQLDEVFRELTQGSEKSSS